MHKNVTERWNDISLRTKITAATVLVLTLGLLISGFSTMVMLRPVLQDQLDQQLKAVAQGDLGPYLPSGNNSGMASASGSNVPVYFVALYDANGTLVTRNWKTKKPAQLPVLDRTFQSNSVYELHSEDGQTEFRAVAYPVTFRATNQPGMVIIAASTDQIATVMNRYLAIFLGIGFLVVVVGAVIIRFLVTSTFGPLREVEDTAASIADGDFSQRLGGATPNTEVGRLNRSLNTMLNRIDRAFKDRARTIGQMRRFVGDASHELRTPLVSVRGYAELYRMGALQSPEEVAQAMDRIEKEAVRMGVLVEDLLELARLDETKPLEPVPVDLVPIARDAAMDAMASAPGRTVTVLTPEPIAGPVPKLYEPVPEPVAHTLANGGTPTGPIAFAGATLARLRNRRPRRAGATGEQPALTAPTALPAHPPTDPAVVLGEENKLRQVITNLMGNAARFTSLQSPLEIRVQVNHETQRATLDVIDHGEGIPPEIREKIFQRFWRADTSRTRETGGSGLGLAIVSSIVASHKGTVQALETPGGGATFRVSLPLATSPDAPSAPPPTAG